MMEDKRPWQRNDDVGPAIKCPRAVRAVLRLVLYVALSVMVTIHLRIVASLTEALGRSLYTPEESNPLYHDDVHDGATEAKTASPMRQLSFALTPRNRTETSRNLIETTLTTTTTTAVCLKSLFGEIDLELVAEWAAYYRVLGFDRIFIWYVSNIREKQGFGQLEALPYVTMVENKVGKVLTYENGYTRLERGVAGDQEDIEHQCLSQVAHSYDWVLMADPDEFLWWDVQQHNGSFHIKGFLQHYHDYHYLSFGKWMYSPKYQVSRTPSSFFVEQYPFTAKSFCRPLKQNQRGATYCLQVAGRAKLMVRPQRWDRVAIHGVISDMASVPGARHFDTTQAHFKEWPAIFMQGKHSDATTAGSSNLTQNTNDLVLRALETGIHNMGKAFQPIPTNEENATFPGKDSAALFRLYYNHELEDWFRGMVDQYKKMPPMQ